MIKFKLNNIYLSNILFKICIFHYIFRTKQLKKLTKYIFNKKLTICILHLISNVPKSQKIYIAKIRINEPKYCSHDGDYMKKYNNNTNNNNID